MNKIHVLDCTLRDGGYCNQWRFGSDNVRRITSGLVEADIDIIECGFLTSKTKYEPDVTKFNTLEQAAGSFPEKRNGKIFVAMMNYGEYDISMLPDYDGSSIDGIRLAFHKKDMHDALKLCRRIKEKGYKVFVQPMVSLGYSDEEFLDMIKLANEIGPYAFYIVDSFGMMKKKNLIRLFYMIEHNLDEKIWIGFHSHNNMQLAYSNAQSLVDVQTNRNLIIDSSVYGMGRGAGNLNTELFVEYLNENMGSQYKLKPLLTIIDEILNSFYQKNYWGYSLPNYLSAKHNTHPNYAGYLDDKKTLTVENMDEIFSMMEPEKRAEFDKSYIEELYVKYMQSGISDEAHLNELREKINRSSILLIAPGKSSVYEKDKIIKAAEEENVVSISVNFNCPGIKTDYVFFSNLRRYRDMPDDRDGNYIVTSNIPGSSSYLRTDYSSLLNDVEAVKDNAGLMCVKFLINLGVKRIMLAGFDGYSHDSSENYAEQKMEFVIKNAILDAMNNGMSCVLSDYAKKTDIEFLTTPKYVRINREEK